MWATCESGSDWARRRSNSGEEAQQGDDADRDTDEGTDHPPGADLVTVGKCAYAGAHRGDERYRPESEPGRSSDCLLR